MPSVDDANDAFRSFEIPPSRFFPPVEAAEPDGLLGVAFDGALSPDLVVDALVHGVFPWPFSVADSPNDENFAEESDFSDDEEDGFEEFDEENDDADFADLIENADSNGATPADALFAALSPRSRDAVWEGFDVSSLLRLGELRVPQDPQNFPNLTFDAPPRPRATREILGWWSPDPRAIFDLNDFHVSRRLERTIRSGKFRVSFDEAFPETMLGCANAKGRAGGESWITREFYASYCRLFELGLAHSAECWLGDRLVGGVYGVAVNGFFDGESMFSIERDASKVALVALLRRLKALDFQLFDLQILNDHTASLGGREISRAEYLRRLAAALRFPTRFVP